MKRDAVFSLLVNLLVLCFIALTQGSIHTHTHKHTCLQETSNNHLYAN